MGAAHDFPYAAGGLAVLPLVFAALFEPSLWAVFEGLSDSAV